MHNRSDSSVCDRVTKVCSIREAGCFADINICLKIKENKDIYGQLLRNLQLLFADYEFIFIQMIIGAVAFFSKCLKENLVNWDYQKEKLTSRFVHYECNLGVEQ